VDFENTWKRYALLFLGVIIGAVIGFGIIGWYTGDFFAYSKSQVEQWNHAFGWPSLPFTTWRGARMLWLDGLGLFVVVLALISLVRMVYLRFVKFVPVHLSVMEIMSMGYLVMILVYVLFFHPEEDGRTSLLSMHRYVFCSPFFYFLLLKNMNRYSVNRFTLRILLAALLITLLAIGFPTSELLNWSYTIVLFYVAVILFFVVQSLVLLRSAWSLPVIMMISLVNLLLQIYLFHSFLNGNWVG
jgi:MFS family permease